MGFQYNLKKCIHRAVLYAYPEGGQGSKSDAHDKMGFQYNLKKCIHRAVLYADPEEGQGSKSPLKNHKYIEFLSNTGPDPLKVS